MAKQEFTTLLCEKPSQAADWARFLGFKPSHKKRNHYIDPTRNIAIIHGVGHLFELAPPEHYVPELAKSWLTKHLPVFPTEFVVQIKDDMKPLFNVITGVLAKTERLLIATDADNEGELIARDIIGHSGFKGKIQRVLYSSTDKKALEKAWNNPVPEEKTRSMAKEADLRRKLDWIVGMNLTMGLTSVMKSRSEIKSGAFSVGRVITATAMIVYLNELARKNFKEQTYFIIKALCKTKDGKTFEAKLRYPDKYLDEKLGRCVSAKTAKAFADAINGAEFKAVEVVSQKKNKKPPLPHDLASLQSAVDKFEIDAKETLMLLQTLYDQPLSCVTYPRTECRYLPEGMLDDVKLIANHLNDLREVKRLSFDTSKKPSSFNDKKVDVHHGIIPTVKPVNLQRLTEKQLAIYLTIALRYIAQFMEDYEYLSQSVVLQNNQILMDAGSIKVTNFGWREAEKLIGSTGEDDADADEAEAGQSISIEQGDLVKVIKVDVVTEKTKKPSALSTAKLVEAMKKPGKYVTNPDIASMLNDGDGIGTSATRSDTIDRAIQKRLIQKVGRSLQPTKLFEKHAAKFTNMDPGFTALLQRSSKMVLEGTVSEKDLMTQYQNYVRKLLEEWVSVKA
jgi:DNA topoisomerase-3